MNKYKGVREEIADLGVSSREAGRILVKAIYGYKWGRKCFIMKRIMTYQRSAVSNKHHIMGRLPEFSQ